MYSIRKVRPMKVNDFQFSISILLTMIFIFTAQCQIQDKNILDFSQALEQETPSQSATRNFKQGLHAYEIDRAVVMDSRKDENESRMSVFHKSFMKYVKEIYNRKDYPQALSQDASHIIQFLDLSNELNLDAKTVYVYMRLWVNKAKSCEVMDDRMILQSLRTMPSQLARHFISEDDINQSTTDLSFIKHQIESTLLAKFTENFPAFQAEPDVFLSNLSQDLTRQYQQEIDHIKKQHDSLHAQERLRNLIIKFFEITLNKVVWEINEYENPWQSFIAIADGLSLLAEHDIITHMDELDDLWWSLVHRFCFFLDIAGASIPENLFDEIEHDLDMCSIPFLESEEQDAGIISKKETLFESLLQAKTRAFAYERGGIISMPMITRKPEGLAMNDEIVIGQIYKHYSGKEYRVLGLSRHSETLEEMVVYQGMYDCPKFGLNPIWVRSKSMFTEYVEIEGILTPRFKAKPLEQSA